MCVCEKYETTPTSHKPCPSLAQLAVFSIAVRVNRRFSMNESLLVELLKASRVTKVWSERMGVTVLYYFVLLFAEGSVETLEPPLNPPLINLSSLYHSIYGPVFYVSLQHVHKHYRYIFP